MRTGYEHVLGLITRAPDLISLVLITRDARIECLGVCDFDVF